MRSALRFLLVPVLAPLVALAADKPTIAVMDFTANNASSGDASVLSELVREAVINSGEFTVVDKKNMDKLLQEQAFQRTGCTSEECAVKLGKVLNVQKMVVGSYSTLGQTRFLTARLVDVETGKSERSANVKGFEVADADSAAASLVNRLMGREEEPVYRPPNRQVNTGPREDTGKSKEQLEYEASQAYKEKVGTTKSDTRGYLMLFLGPVNSGYLAGYTQKSWSTARNGAYAGDPIYTVTYDKIPTVSKSPAFGLRIGGLMEAFAFDGEFSYGKWATVPGDVNGHYTTNYPDYYGYNRHATGNFTRNFTDEWIDVSAVNFGMNIYLGYPGKVLQPYVGLGLLMGIVNVSSMDSNHVGITDEPLNATTLGFSFQFPFGMRIITGKDFFLYAEWRPMIEILAVSYFSGPSNNESDDTFNIHANQGLFGVGFFF